MRRLQRKTLFTQDNSLEVRVEQLERRIFPQATKWAYVDKFNAQTLPGGAAFLTFDRFWTNAPTIFHTGPPAGNDTAGDSTLFCSEFGVYVATSSVEWEDIGADFPHQHSISEGNLIGANLAAYGASAVSASEVQFPLTGDRGPLDTGDASIGVHSPWDHLPTQLANWRLLANNQHSTDVDVLRAFLMVALLPSDEKEVDYVVYD